MEVGEKTANAQTPVTPSEEAEAEAKEATANSIDASDSNSAESVESAESEESTDTKKSVRKPTVKDSANILKEVKDTIKRYIDSSPDEILESILNLLSVQIKDSKELNQIVKKSEKQYKLTTKFNLQEKSIPLSKFLDTSYAKPERDLIKFLNQLLSISLDSIKDKLIQDKFIAFFNKYTQEESYVFKQTLLSKFSHSLQPKNKE